MLPPVMLWRMSRGFGPVAFKIMMPMWYYILPRLSNTYLERIWYHIISWYYIQKFKYQIMNANSVKAYYHQELKMLLISIQELFAGRCHKLPITSMRPIHVKQWNKFSALGAEHAKSWWIWWVSFVAPCITHGDAGMHFLLDFLRW